MLNRRTSDVGVIMELHLVVDTYVRCFPLEVLHLSLGAGSCDTLEEGPLYECL